jgi:hypothetical protein
MAQRIKGQSVEIIIVSNGVPLTNITTIRSFEMSFQTEILREGYLGETTDRRDSIFRGISARMSLHVENQDILALFTQIVDKARQRVPGLQVNVKVTLNFPNGQRPRVMIPDVEFGELPFNFGSRSDYGEVSLSMEAQQATIITA